MQKISIATKASAIADYFSGNGDIFIVAKRYGISEYTLLNWIKTSKDILKPHKENVIIPLRSSFTDCTGLIIRTNMEEIKFKTKDAEIKYLKDKIAYLESLSELMGYNINEVPKKKDLKSSSSLYQAEDVTTLPDSAE
ncbi:MAG: hypothetical protein Q4B64_10665 [Spirochaetales bacterium]|nr:hypothetical protein [Spirochaetales bacterium]